MCQFLVYYTPFDGETRLVLRANETTMGKPSMANEAETNGCACGGNCAGAANKNVNVGDSVRSEWGKAVATAAIKELHPDKDNEQPEETVDAAEVQAFIDECTKAGESVPTVVSHIAKREGIDLSAAAPKDDGQRKLWAFLLQVLKAWVIDIAKFAAEEIKDGTFDWKTFVQDYLNGRFGQIFKSDSKPKAETPSAERTTTPQTSIHLMAVRPSVHDWFFRMALMPIPSVRYVLVR